MKKYISAAEMPQRMDNCDTYETTRLNRLFIREELQIPDFGGWKTLKCDLHSHSVFSDGLVWPDQRVYEAWQDGLDAIAITDHTNYHINTEWIKGNLNDVYQIASKAARDMDFLLVPGVEITDRKPFGHFNALFISDACSIEKSDPLEALAEAERQNAFISWNHPGWPDNKVEMYPLHRQLLEEKRIHAIEVMNYKDMYPAALNWCIEYGRAPLATADAHCTIKSMYYRYLRPMTLVFAEEKNLPSLRDALFEGRTIAFFDGKLAGDRKYVEPLVKACIQRKTMTNGCVSITNLSDIPFELEISGEVYLLPERKTIITGPDQGSAWIFRNCYVGNDSCLQIHCNPIR